MRKGKSRGNSTPRVKVDTEPKAPEIAPDETAQSEHPKVDPNLDEKGWPVRVGSIIQIENDVAVVKTVDNGALICRQLNDTDGGDNSAWNCRNVRVIPGLTYHDDDAKQPAADEKNVDANGKPICIGAVVREVDNTDQVGIVEAIHDGGVIFRVISGDNCGECNGWQCDSVEVTLDQLPASSQPIESIAPPVPTRVRELQQFTSSTMQIAKRLTDVRTECADDFYERPGVEKIDDIVELLTKAGRLINDQAMTMLEVYSTSDFSHRRKIEEPWPEFE